MQIRSHTLPTGEKCGSRFKLHTTGCFYCGEARETEVHAFESCAQGEALRAQAQESLRAATMATIEICESEASELTKAALRDWAGALPRGHGFWKLAPLAFLPVEFRALGARCQKRLHDDWHKQLIQLTGRIWAKRMKRRSGRRE